MSLDDFFGTSNNKRKTYSGKITKISDNQVFCYGANPQFRHGRGSAKFAYEKCGALYGKYGKIGHQGNSYAIITKDLTKYKHPSISKEYIITQIIDLYKYAIDNKDLEFIIAYSGIGVNLNGYSNQEMADMFKSNDIPINITFEENFNKLVFNI